MESLTCSLTITSSEHHQPGTFQENNKKLVSSSRIGENLVTSSSVSVLEQEIDQKYRMLLDLKRN